MPVETKQVVFVSSALKGLAGVYCGNNGYACSIVLAGPEYELGGVPWLVREIGKAVQRCQAAIPDGVITVTICEGPCLTAPTSSTSPATCTAAPTTPKHESCT